MTIAIDAEESIVEAPLMTRVRALAFGQSAVKLCYVAIAFVLVRSLTTGTWNEVALALSIYMVATAATTLSLEQSIVYQLPLQSRAAAVNFARRTLSTLVALGLSSALVLIFIEWQFSLLGAHSMVAIALTVLVDAPLAMVGPWLIVNRRETAAGWWMGGSAVLLFCGVVAMSIPSHASTRAVLWGLAIGSLARVPVALRLLWPLIRHRSSERSSVTLRLQFHFCIPLALALTGGVLTRTVDKWMVAIFDPSSLGAYVIAAQEIPLLSVLPYAGATAIAASLSRKLGSGRVHEAFDEWSHQVVSMIDVVVPVTLALVVVGPELLRLMSGGAAASAALSFQLFTIIGLHRVTEYGAVLRAAGRSADVIKASVVLLVANTVLAAIGGAMAGMMGVTIGSLTAFAVAWIFALRLLGRVLHKNFRQVYPWRRWFVSIALHAVPMTAVALVATAVSEWMVRLLVKVVLLVGVAVVVRVVAHGPGRRDAIAPAVAGGMNHE